MSSVPCYSLSSSIFKQMYGNYSVYNCQLMHLQFHWIKSGQSDIVKSNQCIFFFEKRYKVTNVL